MITLTDNSVCNRFFCKSECHHCGVRHHQGVRRGDPRVWLVCVCVGVCVVRVYVCVCTSQPPQQ